MLKRKKGATLDNIWVMLSLFFLAIFFLALHVFWNVLYSSAGDLWTGSSIGTQIRNDGDSFINQLDYIFMIVWLGFHIGILGTVFLLRSHPIFYIGAIFLTAIMAMLAAPISNAYEDITADADLSAAALEIPKTNFLMANLPKFEIIWALITSVVLFGLAKTEGIL